jgi:hypothetical protein
MAIQGAAARSNHSVTKDMINGAMFPGLVGGILGLQMGGPLRGAMIGVAGAAGGAVAGVGMHALYDAVPVLNRMPPVISGIIAGGALPAAIAFASKLAPGEAGAMMRSVAGTIALVSIPAGVMVAGAHHTG